MPTDAAITVNVTAPGGAGSAVLPDEGGSFEVNLPLNRNAVNNIQVTATDSYGNTEAAELAVTQLSLDQIVVSRLTSERLSTEEVEQLVADGVIDLEDPENFNVSTFTIVLTIDKEEVPISLPIVFPKGSGGNSGGSETYRMPPPDDPAGQKHAPRLPPEIIFFAQEVSPSGTIEVPPIPGVIIIEGRIKSLKEFFSVRLMLMNTSGIFTLSNVVAEIGFPAGGLSHTLPADGIVSFGDILPGTPDEPGQLEREFIIRGDEIGIHDVTVNFGGSVVGPGIAGDDAVPFNGSATTDVEVKGPPDFQVTVLHPDFVIAGEPYDLTVRILNTGELPAMYASLELDVSADAQLVNCELDAATGEPDCEYVQEPVTRALGHLDPGETISETFTVLPSESGAISSCMGISDQNVSLQVVVGTLGCAVGHNPPMTDVPAGIPAVSVAPAHNAQGISTESPVVAFFSELMNHDTITTGSNGTFNVYDDTGRLVKGKIRIETNLSSRSMAIWQVDDGVLNRWRPGEKYTVWVSQAIRDRDGNHLYNEWLSVFKTTTTGLGDVDPPLLTLSIEPPVNPNYVLPGEIVRVNAYASDQGSGVARVELRIKDMSNPTNLYKLVDQKSVFHGNEPPFIFALDSSNLTTGRTYQLMATAYDGLFNGQNATISIVMAPTADPPTIVLPGDPVAPQLQGISVRLKPVALTGGVRRVRYFLDGALVPYKTVTLPPWQATLSTLTMSLTTHVVRAVAEDGLGQTGFDDYDFELVENLNMPVISFNESDGAVYVMGDIFSIDPSVEDDVGVRSIHVFIASATNLVSTNASPILINTTNLALGTHRVIVLATNNLGVANDRFDPDSYLEFTIIEPPPGVPPAAPMVTGVSPPEGLASKVTGTSVANARINIRNTNQNVAVSVYANSSGAFTATINANVGNVLSLVAYDFTQSPDPSPPTVAVVPPKPVIMSIRAYPSNAVLPSAGAFVDLVVTGFYQGGSASNVTGKATFSSSVPSVASVSSAGRVVALKRGAATISAAVGSNAATAEIFADIVKLTNITAAPKSVLLAGVGNTRQLAVTGQYNNGTSGPLNSGNTFVSGNPAIATVSLSGLITAVSDGLTQISVYRSGLPSAFVNVSVDTGMDPPPTVDILSPPSGSGVERNELVPVSVRAQDPTNGVTRIYLAVSGATTFTDQRQISPSKKDTTQVFNFTVSSNAPISGVITVRTWAVDTSAHTSTVDSIVLQLGDGTSPQVFISSPIPETAYGYGETVTVVVVASDAVGVKIVRCYATGALSSDETRIYGASVGGTNEVFSISVPFGAPYPDVTLHAEAWDDENNKGTAINVPIVLSDADITPPATEVTAVADPGVGTTATVTYEVTDGLDDLDHVEIYFRRDGYGTFNRYTDADGGNSLGHYDPGGVAVGSLIFDSAKMGGDGTYEFYSIGVDQYGNRGLPPTNATGVVTADEVRAFSAGTVWITISSPTNISLGNTAYDNVNLRIDGVTVTINGHHMFHNVELLNGAVVTHPDTTTTAEYGVDIDAWTVTVDSNSAVNVDELGYLGGEHAPNTGMNEGRTSGNVAGSTQRSGGSYGGTGGAWGGTPCALYGDLTAPSELGSGGSRGGSDSWWGGDGGGKILIQAINIVNDGLITSDGQAGHGYGAGGGSGGSVYLIVTTASGRGDLTADGGGNEVAGGGGRIAVHYVDIDTWDTTLLHALGGQGNWVDGGNGTVFLKGVDEGGGTLVVDGQGAGSSFSALPIPPGHVFDNIIIRNTARVVADDELVVSNKIEILTGSIMTHSLMLTDGVRITCKRLEIDSSSSIDVGAKGYRGGERDGNPNNSGFTLAEQMGSSQSAGGSYGGYGGASAGVPNPVYGSDLNPAYLGSGGSRGGSDSWAGGNGGGRVTIEASEAVVVEGVIRADGQVGAGDGAGGGSGGSIKIDTSLLRGSGSISANGGGNEIGGGGGRILIDYDYLGGKSDDLNDLRNIGAFGGSGTWSAPGGAGTVVMRRHSQSYGDLYVDDNKVSTSTNYTWLTHVGFGTVQALSSNMLLLDQTVRVLPGGLVGLEINPDLTQQTTFDIIGNSATSITVDVSGGTNLTDVAAPGDGYAAIHRFDNIFFRRGGSLRCGDKVVVGDTVRIDEHGKLTHFKATTTFESRLDLTVGTLELSSNGYINADAVGYLGGEHHQNVGVNSGRTENNSAGSTERAGGSYGGLGGHWGAGAPNSVYGSMTNPEELGSGGSRGGSDSWWGGDGGGWVRITAGAIANDGIISANGQGGHGDGAGGGSGGTIDIHADSLSGSGIIRANGGGNEVGGGGGRIAIRYNTLAIDQSHLEARAGSGNWTNGGNGTLFLKHSSQTYGDLVVDGHNVKPAIDKCPILDGYEFDNIIFRNKARVTADAGLNVAGALRLQTNSVLTHTLSNENGLQVHANNIEIDAGSSIDVTARGYRGGERPGNTDNNNGLTLAGQIGSSERSGGSFGGYGASYGAGSPNPAYGDPHNPIYLGSGGSRGGSDSWAGGSGGGRIDLVVSNDLTVN
ncbi:MAG: Ig-like domain-containing protein [Verrucomicrobia bacterium]|nr:Ig-like domain-containing protein [Verrucomicrobiota bacterium]